MKKIFSMISIVAMVLTMSLFDSCGTKEQYSKEYIERDLKAFLAEYVNTINDNIKGYLSDDFNDVIKQWDAKCIGEWDLFGLNSSANVQKYRILSLSEPKDERVCAHVKLFIECEGDDYEKDVNIYLILVADRWIVDEIDEVKQGMKFTLMEIDDIE